MPKKQKGAKGSIVKKVAEEMYFPRGGTSLKAARPHAEPSDVLFGTTQTTTTTTLKEKKRKSTAISKTQEKEGEMTDAKLERRLNFKQLNIGMSLLCSVKSITELDLALNLPNGMTGFVSVREVSDTLQSLIDLFVAEESDVVVPELSDLFQVGDYVQAVVIDLKSNSVSGSGHNRVELTLRPSMVNRFFQTAILRENGSLWGEIKSEEDRGFIVCFGENLSTGFLNKADVPTETVLIPGQVCVFSIKKVSSVIQVSLIQRDESYVLAEQVSDVSAGQLVKIAHSSPSETEGAGMWIAFQAFRAFVPVTHMAEEETKAARILYVDYDNKRFGATCLPHLMARTPIRFDDKLQRGTILAEDKCVVQTVHVFHGVEIAVSYGNSVIRAICRPGDCVDDSKMIASLPKLFTPGMHNTCRVIGFDHLEEAINVSMRPSVLSQKFFSIAEVNPGKKVSGTIAAVKPFGLVVALSSSVQAVCPLMHLSEVGQTNETEMMLRYKKGDKVSFRVLKTDISKRSVLLTHKKSLVNSTCPALTRVSQERLVESKGIVEGFVTSIKDSGVYVSFYDDIFGKVSAANLRMNGYSTNFQDNFSVGQVLKTKIISKGDKRCIELSMDTSGDAISPGDLVSATVMHLEDDGAIVKLKSNAIAYLPLSHLADDSQDVERLSEDLQSKQLASFEDLVVVNTMDKRGTLVSNKPSLIEAAKHRRVTSSICDMSIKETYPGFVRSNSSQYGCFVEFFGGLTGLIGPQEAVQAEAGTSLLCQVTNIDTAKERIYLTRDSTTSRKLQVGATITSFDIESGNAKAVLENGREANIPLLGQPMSVVEEVLPSVTCPCSVKSLKGQRITDIELLQNKTHSSSLKVGSLVSCCIVSTCPTKGLRVSLGRDRYGYVPLTDITKGSPEHPLEAYSTNTVRGAYIVRKSHGLTLSFLSSYTKKAMPKQHELFQGYITSISKSAGAFIQLNATTVGRCLIKNLSDAYVNHPEKEFQPGQRVKCRVIKATRNRIEVSMKDSIVQRDVFTKELQDIKVGDTIPCTVRNITDLGVFLQIQESSISGLCHHSTLTEEDMKHLNKGDAVQAEVSHVDIGKQRISFNISSFGGSDLVEVADEAPPMAIDTSMELTFDSEPEVDVENEMETDQVEAQDTAPAEPSSMIHLSRSERDLLQEKSLMEAEAHLSYAASQPSSVEDFERLLVSDPFDVSTWARYIAFTLEHESIDEARTLAQRALSKLPPAAEYDEQRMALWVARLNLEIQYGTEESAADVLKKALLRNYPKALLQRAAELYESNNKTEMATQMYTQLTSKHGAEDVSLWITFATFLFNKKQFREARLLLQHSLSVLSQRLHASMISKFAVLEFKLGQPERGRTLFQGVLDNYPKKTDIWSIFIDQEIRLGDVSRIRSLFERCVQLDLSTKKMKFFFKRYLEFEKEHGDNASVEHVTSLARSFVESKMES